MAKRSEDRPDGSSAQSGEGSVAGGSAPGKAGPGKAAPAAVGRPRKTVGGTTAAGRKPAAVRKAAAGTAKPWARTRPGAYVSADARFRLEQEGPGRWFVVDETQLDELGLARTSGPFATLDDARDAAGRMRDAPAPVSPLAARRATPRSEPRAAVSEGAAASAEAAREQGATRAPIRKPPPSAGLRAGHRLEPTAELRGGLPPAPAASDKAAGDRHVQPEPEQEPPGPAVPPAPAWLERLPPNEATRARRLVAGLQRLGIVEAERIVRADLEAGRPAVARALIARRLRTAALEAWDRPDAFDGAGDTVRSALRRASDAGLSDDELATLVRFVARRTMAATLEQVSGLERDPQAPEQMPGWRLIEHDAGRPDRERRIDIGADDVKRLQLEEQALDD